MRSIIASVTVVLLLSSCGGGEEPTTPSTPSTSPPSASSQPAPTSSPSSPSSETEAAGAEEEPAAASANVAGGSGDPAKGEALFKQPMIAGTPGCTTCHSLQPGVRMVGPSIADAATVAAGAIDGMSAEDYLRQSILEPNAHITEGFMPGLMFQDYGDKLSAQQIDDLVAFLMTQS